MRKTRDWIASWLEYSSGIESPLIFRAWAAITSISGVLQRRVWIRVKGQRLFPNMYTILVGPPGVGKGNAMKEIRSWCSEIKALHVAADGITERAFYDSIESAVVENPENPLHHDSSLFAFIEELGVFLHAGDTRFLYVICHVYDCPPLVRYKTFGAGEHTIENACFGFLAGVTPKALKDIFSEQALELGISARTILVFSDEQVSVPIFSDVEANKGLAKDLQADLFDIAGIRGEYIFDDDAARLFVTWVNSGMPPIPQDPRFEHYNTRRFVQHGKLCIVMAASRRDERVILAEDVTTAQTVQLEAERYMPKAVESLGANPLLYQQQTAIKFINHFYLSKKQATPEAALRRRLSMEVHPTYLDVLIDQLASAQWISVFGTKPDRRFMPRGKTEEKND